MFFDERRFNDFIDFSAEQLNDAYSRMNMNVLSWAKGTIIEVDFIESVLGVSSGNTILDVGCGQGRHSIEFAKRVYCVTGIDASAIHISKAKVNSVNLPLEFKVWDAMKRINGKNI